MPDTIRALAERILALIIGAFAYTGVLTVKVGGRRYVVARDGRMVPSMAGGAPRPGEEDDDADDDPDAEPEPEPTPSPTGDDADPDDDPDAADDFDRDRAMRTIKKQREAERKQRERAEKAEARAKELEDAQLSEQEKVVKDRDEAKAEAQRERDRANKLAIDSALREAALEAGIPAKKIKRALRLVERDEITLDGDEVDGAADAIEALLDDIPELRATREPEPGDEPSGEPAGGAPDRRRRRGQLTAEQVQKMAVEDPDQFNELFEAGKIPASALR